MLPGDRLVVALLNPLNTGDTFTAWPLHVTIVPWFRLNLSSDEIVSLLTKRLRRHQAFQVIMGNEEKFGHNKTVNLVEQPSPLIEIERDVRKLLKQYDSFLVDETTKRIREYRPHVTFQKIGRLHRGYKFIVDTIYIIEQKGSHKEVVGKVNLHE